MASSGPSAATPPAADSRRPLAPLLLTNERRYRAEAVSSRGAGGQSGPPADRRFLVEPNEPLIDHPIGRPPSPLGGFCLNQDEGAGFEGLGGAVYSRDNQSAVRKA